MSSTSCTISIFPSVAPEAGKRGKNLNAGCIIFGEGIELGEPAPMADPQTSETTLLLRAWAEGDAAALDQLTPRVYAELRRIAGYCMQNERPGRTLQTTALVHEAYLRLIDVNNVDWEHRAHFFAVSAQIMRRILVDGARARATAKRGGGMPRVNLDEIADVSPGGGDELIALDDALERLA